MASLLSFAAKGMARCQGNRREFYFTNPLSRYLEAEIMTTLERIAKKYTLKLSLPTAWLISCVRTQFL